MLLQRPPGFATGLTMSATILKDTDSPTLQSTTLELLCVSLTPSFPPMLDLSYSAQAIHRQPWEGSPSFNLSWFPLGQLQTCRWALPTARLLWATCSASCHTLRTYSLPGRTTFFH